MKDISHHYKLEKGRLLGGSVPGYSVYSFMIFQGPWPEVGFRAVMKFNDVSFPVFLLDRQGPMLCVAVENRNRLPAEIPLAYLMINKDAVGLKAATENDYKLASAAKFLDQQDGWLMGLVDVAGEQQSAYDVSAWQEIALNDIAGKLEESHFNFIWRQSEKNDSNILSFLAKKYLAGGNRVLIIGDCRKTLNDVSVLNEALFTGFTLKNDSLYQHSVHTKIFCECQKKEDELAALHAELHKLQQHEAFLKSEHSRWCELDELENNFKCLSEESKILQEQWQHARNDMDKANQRWETAQREADKKTQGFLKWVKKSSYDPNTSEQADEYKAALDIAEKVMAEVRHKKKSFVKEARDIQKHLEEMRMSSSLWTARDMLAGQVAECEKRFDDLSAQIASLNIKILPDARYYINKAQLIATYWGFFKQDAQLQGDHFDVIIANLSQIPDREERSCLAQLAAFVKKRLIIMADFSLWPVWSNRGSNISAEEPGPVWQNIILREEMDDTAQYIASCGPFDKNTLDGVAGLPSLSYVEIGSQAGAAVAEELSYIVPQGGITESTLNIVNKALIPATPKCARYDKAKNLASLNPCGMGLRGYGEIGPANPASALMAARAAYNYAKNIPGDDPAVIIIAPSVSQVNLIESILLDIKAPAGRIFCDEPHNFNLWEKVPLVILDPAFEAPHLSHPWAWPSFGRQKLLWAWQLAKEKIWILGRDAWLNRISQNSPLSILWHNAVENKDAAIGASEHEEKALKLWEALDGAKQKLWAIVPTFEAFWWRPLEEHFLAAARRRVSITIISAMPDEISQREYAAAAIKTLGAYGCIVHLSKGFPGFMAVIDGKHFCWGHFVAGVKGVHVWSGLQSACLPTAADFIADVLQLNVINERLGRKGGGLKTCPQCGWPLVLINQEHMRGFGDDQPLRIGCMGTHSNKIMRRLDARAPFKAAPKCKNGDAYYQRVHRGRHDYWVCPKHPDGEDSCPVIKSIPGDVM